MKKLLLITATILLTSCASISSIPVNNEHMSWADRSDILASVNNWTLRGSVGLTGNIPNGQVSASFYWQQFNKSDYKLGFFGPAGMGSAIIASKGGAVGLRATNQKTLYADNPEELLQEFFGWSVPITNLYYWIRGIPAPDTQTEAQFDEYNHLIKLKQQGWTITYQQYQAVGREDLPRKLLLETEGLRVKIVIGNWGARR